jgi:hypothetical protein
MAILGGKVEELVYSFPAPLLQEILTEQRCIIKP